MTKILVLNGPNLGMLGTREPEVYGHANLDDLTALLTQHSGKTEIDVRQTDDEATLISWLHEAFTQELDVILNPAAFTHYSYALRDACAMLQGRTRLIEVHITNPHTREQFRHRSTVSGVATGVIAGFGFNSYLLALQALTFDR